MVLNCGMGFECEKEFNIKARLKVFFVQRVIRSSKRFNLWITSSVFRVLQAILIPGLN